MDRSSLETARVGERACWLGNTHACEALIVDSMPESSRDKRVAGVYQRPTNGLDDLWFDAYPQFLSDMHRDIGADRFAEFWSSADEPAVAFLNATGLSLGAWTHKWVVSLYGPNVQGAKVPAGYFGIGVLLALGCVSVASVVATRRSVG
jgi:hypothetical protein